MADKKIGNHPFTFSGHIISDLRNQFLTGTDMSPNASNIGFDDTECSFHSSPPNDDGILKQWNIGILGTKRKKIPLDFLDPSFHHSMIPFFTKL
jgi:hypothetical protein